VNHVVNGQRERPPTQIGPPRQNPNEKPIEEIDPKTDPPGEIKQKRKRQENGPKLGEKTPDGKTTAPPMKKQRPKGRKTSPVEGRKGGDLGEFSVTRGPSTNAQN